LLGDAAASPVPTPLITDTFKEYFKRADVTKRPHSLANFLDKFGQNLAKICVKFGHIWVKFV